MDESVPACVDTAESVNGRIGPRTVDGPADKRRPPVAEYNGTTPHPVKRFQTLCLRASQRIHMQAGELPSIVEGAEQHPGRL